MLFSLRMQLPISCIWHSLLHAVCITFLTLVLSYTGLCGGRNSPLDVPDNTVRTYTLQGATPGQDYNVSIQAYVNTTSGSVQSRWVEFASVKLGNFLFVIHSILFGSIRCYYNWIVYCKCSF